MIDRKELRELVMDYGGGRQKMNEKSQFLYDIAKPLLTKFHLKSYSEIELFAEYLKEVGKNTCAFNRYGIELNPSRKI